MKIIVQMVMDGVITNDLSQQNTYEVNKEMRLDACFILISFGIIFYSLFLVMGKVISFQVFLVFLGLAVGIELLSSKIPKHLEIWD